MTQSDQSTWAGQPTTYPELVERLAAVPATMQRLIGDRTNDDLRQPGQDGGFAVVEIICDQQDWEEITGERVTRMLREHTPRLDAYDDSLWSIEHDYASRNSDDALAAFAHLRARIVEILAALSDEQWQRTAVLGDHGEITIVWLMGRMLRHDEHHIAEIMEALA